MLTSFTSIISSIQDKISMVVHIGAGYCAEIGLYENLGISSIILVEPDEQLFNAASHKLSKESDATLLQKGISGHVGERILYQTSNKRFSSLNKPAKILEFYPNLTVTDEQVVETVSLEFLCNEIQLSSDGNNLLVLELQGEEHLVLANTPVEVLHKFKWIIARSGEKELYELESGLSGPDIGESLQRADFDALCFKEDTPPFFKFLFIRNDAAVSEKSLEQKIEGLEQNTQDLELKIGDLGQNTQDLELKIGDLGQKAQDLELNKASMILDLDSLSEKNSNLNILNTALQKDISQFQKDADEFVRIVDAGQAKQANTESQLKEIVVQNKSLTTEISKQKQQIGEFRAFQDELSFELKNANHASRVSNKLAAKTDADLRDLQARYQSAIRQQKEQQALLIDVQDKLGQAAKFYRRLKIEDRNIEGDIFNRSLESIEDVDSENGED
jgi:hypothetical protein